jgi:glycolate oxidase iron-sulfur subunit
MSTSPLLRPIPGVEYIKMSDADRCCSMAGTFSLYYYDLSKEIADKKVEANKSTGADIVVSSCPGCEIQLIDSLLRNRVPVKVTHIMELIQ